MKRTCLSPLQGVLLGAALTLTLSARSAPASCETLLHHDSPAARRFARPLLQILNVLSQAPSANEAAKLIIEKDLRSSIFRIEGLFRFYADDFSKLEKALQETNDFEDITGVATDMPELLKYATKIGLPSKIVEEAKRQENLDRQALAEYLIDHQWYLQDEKGKVIPGPYFAKIAKKLNNTDWRKPKKDRKFFLKSMVQLLEHIQDKQKKLDLDDLEGGIHELRRLIRWFLIEVRASAGLIRIAHRVGPVQEFEELLDGPLAKSDFAKFPVEVVVENPCHISEGLVLGMSLFTQRLGVAKSFGQRQVILEKMALSSGLASNSKGARELARSWLQHDPNYVDPFVEGRKIDAQIKHTKILKHLRHEIEACLE